MPEKARSVSPNAKSESHGDTRPHVMGLNDLRLD
jgi:hypothetical protein